MHPRVLRITFTEGEQDTFDRLDAADAEYIALVGEQRGQSLDLLDAHVAALDSNPELGLVYNGPAPTNRDGGVLGLLLSENALRGRPMVFRASLRSAFEPLRGKPLVDPNWWIPACIACVAELGAVDAGTDWIGPAGADAGDGDPVAQQPARRAELEWRRWVLTNLLDDEAVTPLQVARARAAFRAAIVGATPYEPYGARALMAPDTGSAAEILRGPPPPGRGAPRSKALLRALAYDPFDAAIALDLDVALALEQQTEPWAPPPSLATMQRQRTLVLAWLDDVIGHPQLLDTFAERYAGGDTTLAVLAAPRADLTELVKLFETNPRLSSDDFDATVITAPPTAPGQSWLAAAAASRLTVAHPGPAYMTLPVDAAVEQLPEALQAKARTVVTPRSRRPPSLPGDPPELTIVIPTLDASSARVRDCLAAIRDTTDAPHEVVIVDNGSPAQGFSAPVNAGIRAAATPYIVVMNDDVGLLEGWWGPLKDTLDSGAEVAFPVTVDGRTRSDFSAWCFAMTSGTVERFSVRAGQFFDESLVIWFQDTDLLLRLVEARLPPVKVDESRIRHRESQTLESGDRRLRIWVDEQIARDERTFRAKHPNWQDLPVTWSDV